MSSSRCLRRFVAITVVSLVVAACGGLDRTYNGRGTVDLPLRVTDLVAEPDGGTIVVGRRDNDLVVTRVRPDLPYDERYGSNGSFVLPLAGQEVHPSVAVRPGGGVVVVATNDLGDGRSGPFAVALTRDGRLDPAFGDGGLSRLLSQDIEGIANDVVVRTDGSVVLAGIFSTPDGRSVSDVVGLDATGDPDASFGVAGFGRLAPGRNARPYAAALALHLDGAVVVAGGPFPDIVVERYLRDGRQDERYAHPETAGRLAFPGDQTASSIASRPDGTVVVGGTSEFAPLLVRYLPDGRGDPAFGFGGIVVGAPEAGLADLVLHGDGRVTTVGSTSFDARSGTPGVAVASRYRADGRGDPTFGRDGRERFRFPGSPLEVATLQPSGAVMAGGPSGQSSNSGFLARFTP